MLLEHLELYAMDVRKPQRVLIKPGRAVCLRRARRAGCGYDQVLIREDGWTLGFPHALRDEAYALWPERWEAIVDLTTQSVARIGPQSSEVDR